MIHKHLFFYDLLPGEFFELNNEICMKIVASTPSSANCLIIQANGDKTDTFSLLKVPSETFVEKLDGKIHVSRPMQ